MAYKYQTFPDSLQMIGNTAFLDRPDKVAFLSSRRISPAAVLKCYDWAAEMRDTGRCVIGGFQSSLERDVLKLLLRGQSPIVMVLTRGVWRTVPSDLRNGHLWRKVFDVTAERRN